MEMNLSWEFLLSIGANLCAIAYFAGKMSTTQKFLEQTITTLKESIENQLCDLKHKQDKHNSLIERMVVVEQQAKSAHKRLDELGER